MSAESGRKVLLVIPGLTAGGAERVLTTLAGGLLGRGYRVDVVTIFGPENDFYAFPPGAHRECLDLGATTSRLTDKLSGNLNRIAALRRSIGLRPPMS